LKSLESPGSFDFPKQQGQPDMSGSKEAEWLRTAGEVGESRRKDILTSPDRFGSEMTHWLVELENLIGRFEKKSKNQRNKH
jgi:hypothetical protein